MASLLLAVLVAVVLTSTSIHASTRDASITVFTAASLGDAFGELATTFEVDHPRRNVRFNFAGSQQLALQIVVACRVRVFEAPDGFNVEAAYSVAVLKNTRHADSARAFVALLVSPRGQETLHRHGLIPAVTQADGGR